MIGMLIRKLNSAELSRSKRSPRALVIVEPDRRKAIALALAVAERGEGDVVVVAGKGHESGQTAGGVTIPFDDRVVSREELARLGWSGGPDDGAGGLDR